MALWRSTFIVSAMTMLSRVLGLVRDVVLLNVFGAGKDFEEGKLSLEDLRKYAIEKGEPATISGQQELFKNIIITISPIKQNL